MRICFVFTSVSTQNLYLQGLSFQLTCEKWFPLLEIVSSHLRFESSTRAANGGEFLMPRIYKHLILEKDTISDYRSKKWRKKKDFQKHSQFNEPYPTFPLSRKIKYTWMNDKKRSGISMLFHYSVICLWKFFKGS